MEVFRVRVPTDRSMSQGPATGATALPVPAEMFFAGSVFELSVAALDHQERSWPGWIELADWKTEQSDISQTTVSPGDFNDQEIAFFERRCRLAG
jgi:hypothetical protein